MVVSRVSAIAVSILCAALAFVFVDTTMARGANAQQPGWPPAPAGDYHLQPLDVVEVTSCESSVTGSVTNLGGGFFRLEVDARPGGGWIGRCDFSLSGDGMLSESSFGNIIAEVTRITYTRGAGQGISLFLISPGTPIRGIGAIGPGYYCWWGVGRGDYCTNEADVRSDEANFTAASGLRVSGGYGPPAGDGDYTVEVLLRLWQVGQGPPPAVVDDIPGLFGVCTFTATVTLTDTVSGITNTEVITYERPANLLKNPSFEDLAGIDEAQHWSPVRDGVYSPVSGHYFRLPGIARTGSGVVFNATEYELWQGFSIYTTGNYVAGMHATAEGVTLKWNNAPIVSSEFISTTPDQGNVYAVYSGTRAAIGASGINLILEFDGAVGGFVDDVFVYPTDEEGSGDLICDPAYYEPFDADSWSEMGAAPVGGVPAPIGGAGAVCYNCIPPVSVAATHITYWIAWLGCVLRNMFSCSLRVWLLAVGNWTNGVIQYFMAFASWVPATAQQGADWFMGSVVPGLGGVTVINQGTSFFDLLIAIIGLIETLITSVSNVLLGVVNLLISIFQLLPQALAAEPYQFSFNGGSIGIGGEGPSDGKRLYAFLLFLSVIDQVVVGHSEVIPILLLAMGAMTITVIIWLGYWWRDVIQL